jgi:1-deoxy-D-xylulose-5-phosphate reductoisomerase
MQETVVGNAANGRLGGLGNNGRRIVSVFGATGSVGQSTLDMLARHPDDFELDVVTANGNAAALADMAKRHRARLAVIAEQAHYDDLRDRLKGSGIAVAGGRAALIEAAQRPADCVVAAIIGAAGLEPTLAAVAQGRRVALANKECLVSAGRVFMGAVRRHGTELVPVDSEHSAAFQVIEGQDRTAIERIILTASGGPFREWSAERIATATPAMALKHPNWSMGRKITIDSATLMNKGLELIEALHLFDLPPERLDVVVHPQSIIHCLVEYADGSVLAQLSNPDMRTPIALSLAWPRRISAPTPRLDLVALKALTFETPDTARFPALELARDAMRRGGGAPAVLNAANEVAVEAFLDHRVTFPQIAQVVADTLAVCDRQGYLTEPADLGDVLAIDAEARRIATGRVAAPARDP